LNADVALLEFPASVGIPLTLADSSMVNIGDDSFVVGFPMGITEQVLLGAHVASITPSSFRIDASVNHGNSGGPLLNVDGAQIGIVNAKHGSLSAFLNQVSTHRPGAGIIVGGIDTIGTIQQLIIEMQKNLNLGIGYAVATKQIKTLHPLLDQMIP
jgi:serine protease Do